MAVALDQNIGSTAETSADTCALTNTGKPIAANSTIVVVLGSFHTGSPGTHNVSGGGLTWTADKSNTSGQIRVSVYRAYTTSAISGGALTITGTSTATSDVLMCAASFTGITDTSPARASNGGSGSSSSAATGTIASSAGDFLFAGYFEDGSGTLTFTTTATELHDFNSAGQAEAEGSAYKLSASANDSITFSLSASVGWVCSGVAYIPAAGGGTQVTNEWALAYDILNQVTREWALAYDIKNQVTREWALAYDILNQVTREWALAYDILNQVSREWALSYDILNQTSNEWALAYDILSASQVTREWALAYDIDNQVANEWALSYDLLNGVTREWALSYDILNQTSNEWALAYDIGIVAATNNLLRLRVA